MKYFKFIAKMLAVLMVVCAIALAALIWRVHHAPLDLKFLLSYLQTKDTLVTVDSIQLQKSAFYKIPKIHIQNLQYQNATTQIQCDYIQGHWNLWDVMRGRLSLSGLMLFKPKIIVRLKESTPEDGNSLKILETMPFSELTIIDGMLTVIPAHPTLPPVHIHQLNLIVNHRNRLTNWDLKGLLFNRIPIESAGHYHHKTLTIQTSLRATGLEANDLSAYTTTAQDYLPLFGTEKWNINLEAHLNTQTEITCTWHPIQHPNHVFSAQLAKTPSNSLALTFKLPALDVQTLPQKWPVILAPDVRTWIIQNIPQGIIPRTEICLSLAPDTHEVKSVNGTTSLQNAYVKVWDRLSPLYVHAADFTFDQTSLSVALHKGVLEDIPLTNGKIILSDNIQHLQIHSTCHGDVQPIFKLLDKLKIQHPLISPATKGTGTLDLSLGFPLQNPNDLQIDIHGDLKHLSSKLKLLDQVFTFANGEFYLGFNNDVFTLKGQTILENKPLQISLQKEKPLEQSSVLTYKIHGQADSKVAKAFLPLWLKDVFKDGVIAFNIESKITPEQAEQIILEANLKMIALNIVSLGWQKLRNADATLNLEMISKDAAIVIPKIQLESQTLKLNGNLELKDKRIESVNLNASIKNKQKIKISTKRIDNNTVFSVSSNFLDARPFIKYYFETDSDTKEEPAESSSPPYQADLDMRNIQLENDIKVPVLKGKIIYNGHQFKYIDITASTTQDGRLTISLKPNPKDSVLQVQSSKFHQFMMGLNMHKKWILHDIDLTASRPLKNQDAPYVGKVTAEKIRMYNAPLIGHILSFMSFSNLVSQLKGKGLLFDSGEVEFSFLNKKLTIKRSAIANNALGLSFEGLINFQDKVFNLTGAAVPINVLNKMLGNIPVLGTLLSGGDKDKGVFSSSYKITGTFDNPIVSSNPFGVVVPNLFKKILGGLATINAKPTES